MSPRPTLPSPADRPAAERHGDRGRQHSPASRLERSSRATKRTRGMGALGDRGRRRAVVPAAGAAMRRLVGGVNDELSDKRMGRSSSGAGRDLPGDLLEGVVDREARVAWDPGAVDRHHPRLHPSAGSASLSTSANSSASARLWRPDKARDRRVIGNQVAGDDAASDVVTLDHPRRPHLARQTRTTSAPRSATAHTPPRDRDRAERHKNGDRSISPGRVDHKPRQVIRRQPLPDSTSGRAGRRLTAASGAPRDSSSPTPAYSRMPAEPPASPGDGD
jgi:hypothetical protein